MPNRLRGESSPYLRQHADNPVDWYPWGPEAHARARTAERPILLSIGYAACHWCHVMAHESFEDAEIAARMNAAFVNIKVDREERPDLDAVYQTVCQMTGRSGGWPLTVFLTPALQPFFVGTYFPPRSRHGLPGFAEVLEAVAGAWSDRRAEVLRVAGEWTEALHRLDAPAGLLPEGPAAPVAPAAPALSGLGTSGGQEPAAAASGLAVEAAARLLARFDHEHGGFGAAPKFPNPEGLELLLRSGGRARACALVALRRMAEGGVYDQLGGGFHRYSVDAAWRVPHFEKMLYDSALLIPIYLAAWQLSGEALYARIAAESCDFLLRDLRAPQGTFYGTLDADSEGGEGRYYVWSPAEIRAAVGEEHAALLIAHFGVTPEGNFEGGRTVLAVASPEAPAGLQQARAALLRARARRVPPARDEKVQAGWNGLAVSALAQAGRVLDRPAYVASAAAAAVGLRRRLGSGPDGLAHTPANPGRPAIAGFLQDYAYVCNGLLDLYEATFETDWVRWAADLAAGAVRRFYDAPSATMYQAEAGADDLIHRPRDLYDAGTPSGQSMLVRALLRLQPWLGDAALAAGQAEAAHRVLAAHLPEAAAQPWGRASLLCAADLAGRGNLEVALAGRVPEPWLRGMAARYLPELVLSRVDPDAWPVPPPAPPLWEGRLPGAGGAPRAFVCRGSVCSLPLGTWEELEAALGDR